MAITLDYEGGFSYYGLAMCSTKFHSAPYIMTRDQIISGFGRLSEIFWHGQVNYVQGLWQNLYWDALIRTPLME